MTSSMKLTSFIYLPPRITSGTKDTSKRPRRRSTTTFASTSGSSGSGSPLIRSYRATSAALISMNSGYSIAAVYTESSHAPSSSTRHEKNGNTLSILTSSAVRLKKRCAFPAASVAQRKNSANKKQSTFLYVILR